MATVNSLMAFHLGIGLDGDGGTFDDVPLVQLPFGSGLLALLTMNTAGAIIRRPTQLSVTDFQLIFFACKP